MSESPNKLKSGDFISFISPSSHNFMNNENFEKAKSTLDSLKIQYTLTNEDKKSYISVAERSKEFKRTFFNNNIQGILTTFGGHNSIDLVEFIDEELIKQIQKTKKVFCGFSDSTILSNAIYKKTGVITYIGPNLSTFGALNQEFTIESFKASVMTEKEVDLISLETQFISNNKCKMIPINKGNIEGTVIGGNLYCFHLLVGTEYIPSFENAILFIEDTENLTIPMLHDLLQSLSLQPGFEKIKGVMLGHLICLRLKCTNNEDYIKCYKDSVKEIIENIPRIKTLPIVGNICFGHKIPTFCLPIGGICHIEISDEKVDTFIFTKH